MLAYYSKKYDHTQWDEHRVRVERTTEIAQRLIDEHGLRTVADLSCGDGAIINSLTGRNGVEDIELRLRHDITDGDAIEVTTMVMGQVDLFICSETIEHLEAPWTVLEQIARKTRWLVLSTPLNEVFPSGNWEHYWSFTDIDIETILTQSGFMTETLTTVSQPGWNYAYQIWTARSA